MILEDVAKTIPKEPEDKSGCYTIIFKHDDKTLTRAFDPNNTIQDIINYAKVGNNLLHDIELFEPFPRKIYDKVNLKLSESGLSKNQVLMIKLK